MRHRVIAVALCGVLVLLNGCGSDGLGRQPVAGTVNLNGAPLETGTVSFHPIDATTKTATGGPITAGKFAFDHQKGLAAGKYRVTVNAPKPGTGGKAVEGALPGDPIEPPVELVPAEWNTNSSQIVEVKDSGLNEFNFDIKSKAK